MPFSKDARSKLSEQFADIFQIAQEEYRELLSGLRDERVTMEEFTAQAQALMDKVLKLKRIHVQLVEEREALRRQKEEEAGDHDE